MLQREITIFLNRRWSEVMITNMQADDQRQDWKKHKKDHSCQYLWGTFSNFS